MFAIDRLFPGRHKMFLNNNYRVVFFLNDTTRFVAVSAGLTTKDLFFRYLLGIKFCSNLFSLFLAGRNPLDLSDGVRFNGERRFLIILLTVHKSISMWLKNSARVELMSQIGQCQWDQSNLWCKDWDPVFTHQLYWSRNFTISSSFRSRFLVSGCELFDLILKFNFWRGKQDRGNLRLSDPTNFDVQWLSNCWPSLFLSEGNKRR